MTTSGTYTFALENVDIIDEGWERCGIDPASVTARHLRSARRSLELTIAEWAVKGVHLWAIDEQTFTVADGTATYNTPVGTQSILEMVVRRDGIDTDVNPIARDEYHQLPTKDTAGLSSDFYFDRQRDTPTITLWPVPDNATDEIRYYRVRRMQDAGALTNTPDIPYYMIEAFISSFAAKLAEKYAPEREASLLDKAQLKYEEADTEDRQRTPTTFRVRLGRRR